MCQQWFSIIGLTADITGFLLIVREWQFGWMVYLNERNLEIGQLYEKRFLWSQGRANERTDYEKDADNPSLPKHMEQGLQEEIRFRTRMFYAGVSLVITGFLLQLAGSLPGGVKIFHVASCSVPWF
jgi:hypothetical protein